MCARKTLWRLAVTPLLIAVLMPAAAQGQRLGRVLQDLTAVDRAGIGRTEREVLEKKIPGAVAVWKDETTGHFGQARLLRNYEQNGMICGEVEHIVKIRSEGRYVKLLCRIADGSWKTAY